MIYDPINAAAIYNSPMIFTGNAEEDKIEQQRLLNEQMQASFATGGAVSGPTALTEDYAKTLGSIFIAEPGQRAGALTQFIGALSGKKGLDAGLKTLGLSASIEGAQEGNEGLFLETKAMDMYNTLMAGQFDMDKIQEMGDITSGQWGSYVDIVRQNMEDASETQDLSVLEALNIATEVLFDAEKLDHAAFKNLDGGSLIGPAALVQAADKKFYFDNITNELSGIAHEGLSGPHGFMGSDLSGQARVDARAAWLDTYINNHEIQLKNYEKLSPAEADDERLTGRVGSTGKNKENFQKLNMWQKAVAFAIPGGDAFVKGVTSAADYMEGRQTKVGMVLGMLQQDELYEGFPKDTGDVLKMSADKQVELLNTVLRYDKEGETIGAMRRQFDQISKGDSDADKEQLPALEEVMEATQETSKALKAFSTK